MSSLQSWELLGAVVQAAPAESAPRHRKWVIRNYYRLPFAQIIYLGKMTNFGAPGGFIKVIKKGKKKPLVAVRLSIQTSFVLLHLVTLHCLTHLLTRKRFSKFVCNPTEINFLHEKPLILLLNLPLTSWIHSDKSVLRQSNLSHKLYRNSSVTTGWCMWSCPACQECGCIKRNKLIRYIYVRYFILIYIGKIYLYQHLNFCFVAILEFCKLCIPLNESLTSIFLLVVWKNIIRW